MDPVQGETVDLVGTADRVGGTAARVDTAAQAEGTAARVDTAAQAEDTAGWGLDQCRGREEVPGPCIHRHMEALLGMYWSAQTNTEEPRKTEIHNIVQYTE